MVFQLVYNLFSPPLKLRYVIFCFIKNKMLLMRVQRINFPKLVLTSPKYTLIKLIMTYILELSGWI